jgi:predicted transcriptional regulator
MREYKRNKLDIIFNILEITMTPAKKTHILYRANINFYQLTKYLDFLLRLEMVEEIEHPRRYRITEKGKQVLNLFNLIGDGSVKGGYQTIETAALQ